MRCLKLAGVTLAVLFCAGILRAQPGEQLFVPARKLPALGDDADSAAKRFSGSLVVRQKDATLYYKIYVVRGSVIGGYDTWQGNSTHFHKIVGGWYDGKRMVLLSQSTQDDFGDKWYSQEHQFEKDGDQVIIKHSLYGFGKTLDTGEVYTPHVIDEIRELPAEEVKRLAAADDSAEAAKESDPGDASPEHRGGRPNRVTVPLKEFKTSIGSVLLYCPAGSFKMGSPATEKGRSKNEAQVSVKISKGFYLGKTSVTQAQFKSVMNSTPWAGKENVERGSDYPATFVDWSDASEFCRRLTARESKAGRLPQGYVFALPTEAQREYACRAGTTGAYSFGPDRNKIRDYAWFGSDAGRTYAHRVAQKMPNPWGFYDLHGNVWEWCRDSFVEKLPGGTDPFVDSGSLRVVRGGSWVSSAVRCRSAYRDGEDPSRRRDALGFRIALVSASEAREPAVSARH